jgi:hypothetical protein
MKSRFPSDILLIVFGPIVVTVIALSVSSLLVHAGEFGQGSMMFVVVVVLAITLLSLLVRLVHLMRRHRSSSMSSSNTSDKSTPTI